jgi:dinuclear metal center YbgI/SA1388 family protein
MSARTSELIAEADRLLEPARFQDYGPNGIQVPGKGDVEVLVTGVSANLELLELAREARADLLIVHHGLFWGFGPPAGIDLALKRRLKVLFDADITLAGYHLPLDAHLELGNAAVLARAIGAERLTPFGLHQGEPIGCIARMPDAGLAADGPDGLFARLAEAVGHEPLTFANGPPTVGTVAIVTGSGTDYLADAIAAGADAFITGEPAERAMAIAKEGSIHFLAAGHHATERFGVRRLGEHLARRFEIEHVFIDVPNPI